MSNQTLQVEEPKTKAGTITRPPVPPFIRETAIQKVRLAKDSWNSRGPEKVSQGNFWGMHDTLFENKTALEDEDLAPYAIELGLGETRLIREVTLSVYTSGIREDFKSVRGGVNGTPTFFINGERYNEALNLKTLLNSLTFQSI